MGSKKVSARDTKRCQPGIQKGVGLGSKKVSAGSKKMSTLDPKRCEPDPKLCQPGIQEGMRQLSLKEVTPKFLVNIFIRKCVKNGEDILDVRDGLVLS